MNTNCDGQVVFAWGWKGRCQQYSDQAIVDKGRFQSSTAGEVNADRKSGRDFTVSTACEQLIQVTQDTRDLVHSELLE